jgi:hypothetical protein
MVLDYRVPRSYPALVSPEGAAAAAQNPPALSQPEGAAAAAQNQQVLPQPEGAAAAATAPKRNTPERPRACACERQVPFPPFTGDSL